MGKENSRCPYYLAKSRLAACDVVVVPYQFILNPELRKQNQINLRGSIIIFDEAHNIDKQCEDILSFELSMDTYWLAYTYLEVHLKYLDHKQKNSSSFDLKQSHDKLEKLIKFLEKWVH